MFGDTSVSVGVVGLVVAILLLVAVLLALIFVEVAGAVTAVIPAAPAAR